MLTHKPGVCLSARKSCAVDSRLLTCSNTDSLSVYCIADRVRLCIFKRDKSYDKISLCAVGKLLILRYDVLKKMLADLELISSLLKGYAKNVLCFYGCGTVFGVYLNHVVAALSLTLEYLECLGLVSGSDDSVGNLTCKKLCRGNVADVRKCYPVAKGAKTVCSSCANVCASKGRFVKPFHTLNEARLFKRFVKRKTDSRGGGRNVLEGGSRRHTKRLLKLLYKLPCVKRIKKIYISGSAVKHLYGKVAAVLHKNAGRLLVRITTVFQFKFIHIAPQLFLFIIISVGLLPSSGTTLTKSDTLLSALRLLQTTSASSSAVLGRVTTSGSP